MSRVGERRLARGWIVHETDPASLSAVLSGEVEIVNAIGGIEQHTTTFVPGEFSGCRALQDSRLVRYDASDVRALIIESAQTRAIVAQTRSADAQIA